MRLSYCDVFAGLLAGLKVAISYVSALSDYYCYGLAKRCVRVEGLSSSCAAAPLKALQRVISDSCR